MVIVIGGLFLLGMQVETKPVETKSDLGSASSTQWSQEGDYIIEETVDGTLVTNEKAGFSFKVPKGWSLETQSFGEEEFTFEFLSPDAVRREGNPPISKGF